jgi:O-antigen/teichoic acid export membrane protein
MDLKKLVTDTITSFGRLLLTIVRGLVIVPVITKLIGTDAYGIWAAVLGLVGIVAAFGSLDASNALVRYTPQEEREGQVLVDVLVLVGIATAITGGALFLIDAVVGVIPTSGERQLLVPAVLLIAVQSISQIIRSYPRAIDEIKTFELLNVVQTISEIIGIGVVLYVTRDIVSALWILIGVTTALDSATLLYYRPVDIRLPNVGDLQRYIQFSLPMVGQTLSSRIIRHADKYLLLLFASPTAAAVYAVCTAISKMIENFMQILNPGLYPKVVEAWEQGDYEGLANLYTFILRWFAILGIPAVAGLGVLGHALLVTISTNTIAEMGTILLPLTALAFLIGGFNSPLVFVINAAERNPVLSNVYIFAAIGNLALNIVLIPLFDVFGAVAATTLAYTLITTYLVYWTRGRISYTLPVATTAKSIVATTGMVGLLWTVPPLGSNYLQMAVYPIFGAGIYFATMAVLGGIPWSDFHRIREIILEDQSATSSQ